MEPSCSELSAAQRVLVFWPPCAFHLSSHLTHGTAHATAGRPQVAAHITLPHTHTHTQACIATYSVVRPVWWLVKGTLLSQYVLYSLPC